ncbi:MAG: hypothetical protein CMF70_06425 [Magnetovibrio sp.]|nr:hypothetical protein [Magnetovibrio sp.]
MNLLRKNLKPPYYAAILNYGPGEVDRVQITPVQQMTTLATKQAGFLGLEAFSKNGRSTMISYWRKTSDIRAWEKKGNRKISSQIGINCQQTKAFNLKVTKISNESPVDFCL